MTARPKIYLAGPDVFRADAKEIGARKKAICAAHGLEGLFPLDGDPGSPDGISGREFAARIYRICIEMMRACDGVIANASPYRGPHMDDGTAFELGWLAASAKPIAIYDNGGGGMAEKIASIPEAARTGMAWTPYPTIEAFGYPVNLMIAVAAAESVGVVGGAAELPAEDLSRFEQAVALMAQSFAKS